MEHDDKLRHYLAAMAARGVGAYTAQPPLWRLLWVCGLKLPPPPFLGFATLFLLTGGLFGLLFGTCIWFIENRGAGTMPLVEAGVVAGVAGALFGLAMAGYYRNLARKHGLVSWPRFADPRAGA